MIALAQVATIQYRVPLTREGGLVNRTLYVPRLLFPMTIVDAARYELDGTPPASVRIVTLSTAVVWPVFRSRRVTFCNQYVSVETNDWATLWPVWALKLPPVHTE